MSSKGLLRSHKIAISGGEMGDVMTTIALGDTTPAAEAAIA